MKQLALTLVGVLVSTQIASATFGFFRRPATTTYYPTYYPAYYPAPAGYVPVEMVAPLAAPAPAPYLAPVPAPVPFPQQPAFAPVQPATAETVPPVIVSPPCAPPERASLVMPPPPPPLARFMQPPPAPAVLTPPPAPRTIPFAAPQPAPAASRLRVPNRSQFVVREASNPARSASATSWYQTYGTDRTTTHRARKGTWLVLHNRSSDSLFVKIDGVRFLLLNGQSLSVEVERQFTWRVEGRDPERGEVPAGEQEATIVIRR